MNILFLSELFYPHGSGAELATSLWSQLLSKEGFAVRIITNRFPGERRTDGNSNHEVIRLPLTSSGGKYSFSLRFNGVTSYVIRDSLDWADIVYVPRFWYSVIPTARAIGKPIIVHAHDYYPVCPLSTIFDFSSMKTCRHECWKCPMKNILAHERLHDSNMMKTIASGALNSTIGRCLSRFSNQSDALVCVAKAQQRLIVERNPSISKRTCVIYNPLPTLHNRPLSGQDFGYFGGLDIMKGFNVLVKAMKKIRGTSNVTVHAAKFKDPKQFANLHNLGIIPYPTLAGQAYDEVYKRIKAVLIPSLSEEPSPYVLVEALMSGRVVIASRAGGIPELSNGSEGVFLVEPGNDTELSDTIAYVNNLSLDAIGDLGSKNVVAIRKIVDNGELAKRFRNLCETLV